MAITPREAAEISPEELARVDQMEQMIDEIIRQQFGDEELGGPIFVPLAIHTTARIRNEVVRRYRDAGWKVGCEWDQREGCSLTFEPMETR